MKKKINKFGMKQNYFVLNRKNIFVYVSEHCASFGGISAFVNRKPIFFSSEAFEEKKLNTKLTGYLFALFYNLKRILYFFIASIKFCGWYVSCENCP